MSSRSPANLIVDTTGTATLLVCSGSWTFPYLKTVSAIPGIPVTGDAVVWDMSAVTEMDSAGAAIWHLHRESFAAQGLSSTFRNVPDHVERLYRLLYDRPVEKVLRSPSPGWLYRLGKKAYLSYKENTAFLAFLGEAFTWISYLLFHPRELRVRSIGAHILATGATALPIIALSAFLIGVVIAFQSIVQLQKFGADIFIVDTIGISLSRELAPLITAIIVAGRSGSAFTAQIGTMKMTQEIDAMKTMGFDPFVFLVWPRIIALMIVMPLLIFFADLIGVFGGMVVAHAESHLSFEEFLRRLQNVLALKHFIIGIVKGPFFAFLIAITGVYRGFQVSMNTESIGTYTTKSVVNAIFAVIACDAIFSVLLTELKL